MFESISSMSTSGPGRAVAPRLEALEDRTTPAAVTTTSATSDASALGSVALASTATVDRAFLAEVGRIAVMKWFLATNEANRGSDPQIQSFAQQLASGEQNLLNDVLPALARSGVGIQLTPTDLALIQSVPSTGSGTLDGAFLYFSSLYTLQANGLAQSELAFGTDPNLRAFAQAHLTSLQSQLQTEFGLLGPTGTNAVVNTFVQMGGFGPLSASGFGTGTGATPVLAPVLGGVAGGFNSSAASNPFASGLAYSPYGAGLAPDTYTTGGGFPNSVGTGLGGFGNSGTFGSDNGTPIF
jgi:hypothetical protein